MEKLSDEKPDDLEIASIGALYRGGNWDKKYWSSSRGKDRYPYPVGYQAVRTHSGNTYRMEIREGLKGPIFAVTSPDGDSYTGQTPDIAWDNFQKKNCPRVKNWLGKRFSSKMDGVELFGFRNPFVQRLLRELVANVNGVAERSLAAPTLASRASKLDNERIEESHEYPNVLPYLGKQQITGKRSMKTRSSAEILIKEARMKRTCGQALLNSPDCNDSKLEGGIHSFSKHRSIECFQGENVSSFKDTDTIQVTSSHLSNSLGDGIAVMDTELLDPECQNDSKHVGCVSSIKNCDRTADLGSSLQVKLSNAEENCRSLLAVDKVLVESKNSACFVEKNILSHEQSNHFGHENLVLTHVGKTQLESSFEAKLEQRDFLTSQKNNEGEYVDLARYSDVCAPDTFDTEKDSVVGSPLEGCKASVCSTKNELDVARPVPKTSISCTSRFPSRSFPEEFDSESKHNISKSMHPVSEEVHVTSTPVDALPKTIVKDSLPETGSSSGSSNPSSEKIDLDLAGQELARSMMTFLLPRAVPLLTKTYVKRRSRHRTRENKNLPGSTLLVPNSAEQVENKDLTDVCRGKNVAKVLVLGPEVNIQEKMKVPHALPGADSLCQLTRIEPLSAGCMTTEPFTENESSKVAKFVIPDSFEDDHTLDSAIMRPYPPTFDEVDIGFFEGIKGNINSPVLPENSSEMRCFCSRNAGCNGEILSSDGNKKDNTEEEIPSYGCMPRHGLSTSNKAEPSVKGPPHYELGDEVPKTETVQLHMICSPEKEHSYSQSGQINFDVQAATGSKDANVKNQVGVPHFAYVGHDNKTDSAVNGLHFPQKIPDRDENDHARCTASDADIRMSLINEVKMDEELHQLISVENIAASVHAPIVSAPDANQNQDVAKSINKEIRPSHVSNFMDCVNSVSNVCLPGENCIQSEKRTNALGSLPYSDIDPHIHPTIACNYNGYKGHPHTEVLQKNHLDDSLSKSEKSTLDMKDSMELIGCYLHPSPVLLMSLASKEDSLQICVLCGLVDSDIRNLFMYMIPVHGYRGNCPSFLGYTSLMLPSHKDSCYREIPFERSILQFIPGRRSLVFSNSIKAPRCRKQNFDCLCTNCTSDYTEENSVEIVHVNFGYVSSVIKLVTTERVSSILACEPNYLIAVEQSGKLHVWIMNFEWSVNSEDFMLPQFDEISVILELKKIPNCNSLIIGHNGLGGFAIWDIFQRVLLAKFSSPGIATFQILPVGLFKWQNKDSLATCMEMDHGKETTAKPYNWCPNTGEDRSLSSLDEDIAVWLLVSADSGIDTQHQVEECPVVPVGCWRLGLLVRNTVVLGSILDPRASAASASSHYGIYGTCDGFLYKWELSSGEHLAGLHPFKCGRVSDIAIDAKSGALAVVGNGCQLLVYAQPPVQI